MLDRVAHLPGSPCLLAQGIRLGGVAFCHVNGSSRAISANRGEINCENMAALSEYFHSYHLPILSAEQNSPNANMVDHSVIAWDELHESEASEASVFCFDNASPEKPCFVDGLVCFISLCLRVFEFQNATRREWNLPQERESFFQFPRSPLRGRQTK